MKRERRICNKTSLILSLSVSIALVFSSFSIHYNLWDASRKRILSFFSQSYSNCTTRILSLWQTTRREEKKRWCWTNAINVQFLFFSFFNIAVYPVHRPWRDNENTMTIINITVDASTIVLLLSEVRHICSRENILKIHSRCLHETQLILQMRIVHLFFSYW